MNKNKSLQPQQDHIQAGHDISEYKISCKHNISTERIGRLWTRKLPDQLMNVRVV